MNTCLYKSFWQTHGRYLAMLLGILAGMAACLLLFSGCAHLQPGADPLLVHAEQAQTVAFNATDLFLKIDDSERGFFRTNAAEMHKFAESLRQPVVANGETNRTWISYLKALDRIKLAYKSGLATSNDLTAALNVVSAMGTVAQQYLPATQPPNPTTP